MLIMELFASIQGEGRRVGHPTIFVRTFGCTCCCPGFGCVDPTNPTKEETEFPDNFDPSNVTKVADLPLFKTGCDSRHSWDGRYRHLAKNYNIEELFRAIQKVYTENFSGYGPEPDLCFTGGEPLIWGNKIFELLHFWGNEYAKDKLWYKPDHVWFETNGTIDIKKFVHELGCHRDNPMHYDVNFTISPKLYHVSGERDAYSKERLSRYMTSGVTHCDIKPVVCNRKDALQELKQLYQMWEDINEFIDGDHDFSRFMVMPVGATLEDQSDIGDFIMKLASDGYVIGPRCHTNWFGNAHMK